MNKFMTIEVIFDKAENNEYCKINYKIHFQFIQTLLDSW